MVPCENCHAPIPEDSAKCPYCGALHAPGGERQYMERLYELKEDVEKLSQVPAQEYRREMGKIGRILLRTFLVFTGVAALFGIAVMLYDKYIEDGRSAEEVRAQAQWEREVFPQLDALYEKGDYEGVWEYVYAHDEDGNHSFSAWEHYDFMNTYLWYEYCLENMDAVLSGEYNAEHETDCIIDALFLIQEREYASYTDEEEALIAGYLEEVRELFYAELGISGEDLDALYEESCIEKEYGVYLDYDTAKKKVGQYVEERNR